MTPTYSPGASKAACLLEAALGASEQLAPLAGPKGLLLFLAPKVLPDDGRTAGREVPSMGAGRSAVAPMQHSDWSRPAAALKLRVLPEFEMRLKTIQGQCQAVLAQPIPPA